MSKLKFSIAGPQAPRIQSESPAPDAPKAPEPPHVPKLSVTKRIAQRPPIQRSTHGSQPMTAGEIQRGYRKLEG